MTPHTTADDLADEVALKVEQGKFLLKLLDTTPVCVNCRVALVRTFLSATAIVKEQAKAPDTHPEDCGCPVCWAVRDAIGETRALAKNLAVGFDRRA